MFIHISNSIFLITHFISFKFTLHSSVFTHIQLYLWILLMVHPNPVQTEKMTEQTLTGLFGSRYTCPDRCSRFFSCCQHLFWDVTVHSSWCSTSFCRPNHPQSLLHVEYWTDATPAFLTDAHVLGETCQLWTCWSLIPPAHCTVLQGASCAPQILSLLAFCRLYPVWDALGSWGVGGGENQGSSLPFCWRKLADRPEHTAPGRGVYSSSSQLHFSGLREESSSPLLCGCLLQVSFCLCFLSAIK